MNMERKMKWKDLIPKVEGVHIAIIKELNDEQVEEWNVYIVNEKETFLSNVLLTSKGYGKKGDEEVKTSTLRRQIKDIPARSYQKVEILPEELHSLTNEYWLSFYIENQAYDKKYIFLAESILEDNFTHIPVINLKGILIE